MSSIFFPVLIADQYILVHPGLTPTLAKKERLGKFYPITRLQWFLKKQLEAVLVILVMFVNFFGFEERLKIEK